MEKREQLDIELDALADKVAQAETQPIDDNKLKTVSRLGKMLVDIQAGIDYHEAQLKTLKAAYRECATKTLPDVMQEIGLNSFELLDGQKVEIKEIVEASLSEANRNAGCTWLQDNGYGGVVKNIMTLFLPKDITSEQRADIESALREYKVTYEEKFGVHAQTLKRLYREMVEACKELPEDIFTTFRGVKAEVVDQAKAKSRKKKG